MREEVTSTRGDTGSHHRELLGTVEGRWAHVCVHVGCMHQVQLQHLGTCQSETRAAGCPRAPSALIEQLLRGGGVAAPHRPHGSALGAGKAAASKRSPVGSVAQWLPQNFLRLPWE